MVTETPLAEKDRPPPNAVGREPKKEQSVWRDETEVKKEKLHRAMGPGKQPGWGRQLSGAWL